MISTIPTLSHMLSSDTLSRVRERAPWLHKQLPEIEREGRVSPAVIDALRDDGCLRLAVPARYGGSDLSLPQALAVVEELARVDGTLGWLVGQVALSQVVFGYLPVATTAEIYADGPDVYAAGAAASKGRAVWDRDAWRVSGRWPLVSGAPHAAWIYLQCHVVEDASAGPVVEGVPRLHAVVFPAGEVRIIETWHGLGLRGSESHDVHVSGARCPADRSCDLAGEPVVASAVGRVAAPAQAGLVAAAVATGTAGAAIEAILALATQKRPAFSTRRLSASPLFQDAIGEAYVELNAARSLLYSQVTAADAGTTAHDPQEMAALRAVAPKVAELAWRVVDTAFALGGSSSVAEGSPLARRLRDARSVGQHVTLGRGFYGRVGALRAGATASAEL